VLQFLQNTMTGSIEEIAYTVIRSYEGIDGKTIALEMSTVVSAVDGPYTNRLVAIFEFRGEMITRFCEYFGPAASRAVPHHLTSAQES